MHITNNATQPSARFHLTHVFVLVSLLVLLIPLGSFFFFRIYENELINKTELELISQAALTSAIYIQEIKKQLPPEARYGIAIPPNTQPPIDAYFTPLFPAIDLTHTPTLPPRPDGIATRATADKFAKHAGKAIQPILQEATRTTLSGIMVLDHQGIVVASKQSNGLSFTMLPEVQRALHGTYASVLRKSDSKHIAPALTSISRGTGVRVSIAVPILANQQLYGVVLISRTPQSILKYLSEERGKFALAVSAILILTLGISWLTSYAISRPIRQLIHNIQQFSTGETNAIAPVTTPRTQEIAQLSASFTELAHSLQSRMHYIRTFATHVSHEFKTPLTSIRGSAELLLDHAHDMPTEKKDRFLNNIIDDTNRLKNLVNKLLQLAKADTIAPSQETTALLPLLERLKSRYQDRNVTLHIACDATLTLPIEQEHSETIFINLCDNATQHHAKDIHITATTTPTMIQILVSDNGDGISKNNQHTIFTPFFTTRREQGGTGLGLGIITSLLAAHNATIKLADSKNGASFRIEFHPQKH